MSLSKLKKIAEKHKILRPECPITDQGSYCTCWAVALSDLLDTSVRKKANQLHRFSSQYLIDRYTENNCGLSVMKIPKVLHHICRKGIPLLLDYPYTGGNPGKRKKDVPPLKAFPLRSFRTLNHEDPQDIIRYLKHAPLLATFDVDGRFLNGKVMKGFDGVYTPIWIEDPSQVADPSRESHTMIIVGYEEEGKVWIVKNSHGPEIGCDGYIRVRDQPLAVWMLVVHDDVGIKVTTKKEI